MEIKQMEYFAACVNAGSFSKASELLYINQSNISRAIQTLEKELNTTLFLRGHKGLVLTLEGEELYKQITEILDKIASIGDSIQQKQISTFSVVTFPSNYISYAFTQICMKHKGESISFRLNSNSPSDILKQVEEGSADLGFLYRSESMKSRLNQILQKRNLEYTPFCDVVPCMYVGRQNPLIRKKKISREEFRKQKYAKVRYDYLESIFDCQKTIQEYKLEQNLADAIIVDSGYGLIQLLEHSDFCYLGHSWLDSTGRKILKTDIDNSLYNNYFPMESYDGKIEIGYVTKKGQGQIALIHELMQIIEKDILKNI